MTTTPLAGLADLEALDVDALDGEQLAIYVAMTRGHQWHVVGTKDNPCLALLDPEWLKAMGESGFSLWDGETLLPIARDTHHWLERPDRDEKAAVQLLCEMGKNGCCPAPIPDDEQKRWNGTVWARVSGRRRMLCVKTQGIDEEAFCRVVCLMYLKAWQAERKAEREVQDGTA